ncbi:1413_t:CDS:2 [Dentiscutata erythropus]|uniref:1413_t:CDS:1 n=1 Tax=Dentiscutata erythropus TaxID=1348616 RepID=A0A9N9EEF9_9GLOM|nr:1413_t:CDS:2 [Dentiscutata erythropus]
MVVKWTSSLNISLTQAARSTRHSAVVILIGKATKLTPYQLVFGQQPQADLQMISMLHRQNIIYEEDIPLENQSLLNNNNQSNITINENNNRIIIIEDSDNDNDLESLSDSIIENKMSIGISRDNSIVENKMNISRDNSIVENKMSISRDNSMIDKEHIDIGSLYRYDSIDFENDNFDILSDEMFQENYKSYEDLSQADTIIDLTQEKSQ